MPEPRTLRHLVDFFASRGNSDASQGGPGGNPVVQIRNAVSKCPDEYPAPGTSELPFITDAQLRESIRQDMSTAHSFYHHREWKGATVLAGAAMEALLLFAIQSRPTAEVQNSVTTLKSGGKLKNIKPDLADWILAHLITVAEGLRPISDRTAQQAHMTRDYGNLIHPSRLQRGDICDRATALGALAGCEMVARELARSFTP